MNKVVVLLSTYNGANYLEQLLNSILNQSNVDVEIRVRDDGSNDGTRSILKNYSNQHKNIIVEYGQNEGWRKSFFDLMFSVSPEDNVFYAFADQDDVWMKDKLSTAVSMIKNADMPMLYHSNLTIVNKELEELKPMYPMDMNPSTKNPEAYFEGIGVGATMVMNDKLLSLIQKHKPQLEVTHDAYVIELANILGCTVYDKQSHILYRRHEENATGYGKNANQATPTLLDRYKKYKKAPKNGFSERAEELLKGYGNLIDKSEYDFLEKVSTYRNKLKNKLYLLFDNKMKATTLRKTLQMKYRVINNTL